MFPFIEYIEFLKNPSQFFEKRGINIPQNQLQNPDDIIQYMMNNGIISQQQSNNAVNQKNQLQKNPNFLQYYNKFFPH